MLLSSKRPLRTLAVVSLLAIVSACDNDSPTNAAPADGGMAVAGSATKAPATGEWTKTIAMTPAGGFLVGNPNAEVKLVEFASYTCSHCAEFAEQGVPELLRDYVASGRVSYEMRSFIRNTADVAASLLTMCQTPAAGFRLSEAFMTEQANWTQPFANLSQADATRLQSLPQDQQIAAFAKLGGLDDFVRPRGVTSAKFDQCLSNTAALDKLSATVNEAVKTYNIPGTPSFLINGTLQPDTANWTALKPKLDAALS